MRFPVTVRACVARSSVWNFPCVFEKVKPPLTGVPKGEEGLGALDEREEMSKAIHPEGARAVEAAHEHR